MPCGMAEEEAHDGGRLQQVREEVHRESSNTDSSQSPDRQQPTQPQRSPVHENMEFFAAVISAIDAFHTASYPYADGKGWQRSRAGNDMPDSPWAVRGRIEYGHIDSDLWRIGAGVALTAGAYEIRWDWNEYHERHAGGSDNLLISSFDFMAAFPLIDEQLRGGFGAGMTWLDYPGSGSDFGVQVSGIVQWFPQHPWVVESYGAWGSIGDARHWRVHSHLGVQVWRCTLSAGYDLRQVGSVDLSGPTLSVSLWF